MTFSGFNNLMLLPKSVPSVGPHIFVSCVCLRFLLYEHAEMKGLSNKYCKLFRYGEMSLQSASVQFFSMLNITSALIRFYEVNSAHFKSKCDEASQNIALNAPILL